MLLAEVHELVRLLPVPLRPLWLHVAPLHLVASDGGVELAQQVRDETLVAKQRIPLDCGAWVRRVVGVGTALAVVWWLRSAASRRGISAFRPIAAAARSGPRVGLLGSHLAASGRSAAPKPGLALVSTAAATAAVALRG